MDWTTAQIFWGIGTVVVTVGFVWWWIARTARIARETAQANEIDDRIAEEARATSREARLGPNVQTALRRSRRGDGDFDDDFDDDFGVEDLIDVVEAGVMIAESLSEQRHPDFPDVARDGLESEMAPTFDPPAKEDVPYEQAPAYVAPEPVRESYSGGSDSGGSSSYDSGSSDSGGGGDD